MVGLDDVRSKVLDCGANWKLNMKRRELIKPDLNPPYTRLCKEEVKLSSKLFGEDLSKQLKEMTEASLSWATDATAYFIKRGR